MILSIAKNDEGGEYIVYAADAKLLWEMFGVEPMLEVADADFYELSNPYRFAEIVDGKLKLFPLKRERDKFYKEKRLKEAEDKLIDIDRRSGIGRSGRALIIKGALANEISGDDFDRFSAYETEAEALRAEMRNIKESM